MVTNLTALDLRNKRRGRKPLAVLSAGVDPANQGATLLAAKSAQPPAISSTEALFNEASAYLTDRSRDIRKTSANSPSDLVLAETWKALGRAAGVIAAELRQRGHNIRDEGAERVLAILAEKTKADIARADREYEDRREAELQQAKAARLATVLKGIRAMNEVADLAKSIENFDAVKKSGSVPSSDAVRASAERLWDACVAQVCKDRGIAKTAATVAFMGDYKATANAVYALFQTPDLALKSLEGVDAEAFVQKLKGIALSEGLAI